MASLIIGVVLVITLYSSKAAQDFKSVSACPRDDASWQMSSDKKKCQGDTPDYLCAAIENEPGNLGEICTKHGLTPAKKCAVLNQQTKNLDSVDCKAPSGCPEIPYSPSDLWRYKKCFEDFYGTTSTAAVTTETTTNVNQNSSTNATKNGPASGGSGAGAAVAVVVVLMIICIIVVILVVFYRKDKFGFRKTMHPHVQVVLGLIRRQETAEQQNAADVENQANEEKTGLLKDGNAADEPNKPKQETAEYAIIKKSKKKEKPVHAINDKSKKKEAKGETYCGEEKSAVNKLKELSKYPVHILKREVDVKDLKYKIVIHSKSIKAHFTAPMISGLKSVQSLDDYNKLFMPVVFTLLQNFCENIEPPRKGWGYEPPSDEITVGADIERIRLMWNSYCDDCKEFPQLDSVYKRMVQRFGTVAVQGDDGAKKSSSREEDDFEELKDKIQSSTLHPDCYTEKGIIITDSIDSARKLIQEKNVVILKGAIGCGKTYALKAIQNHFEGSIWNTASIQEEELGDLHKYRAKTILLCDNLFGKLGCHAFSKNDIEKIEKILNDIENDSSENLKVVIAIHQHVFEDVKKTCSLNFLQNKNLSIDMDKLSDAETLLIFKEQLKEGHCKAHPGCWFGEIDFSSVLSKLSKSPGQVGSPFLSLMYCYFHDLFSEDDFTKYPVQSLVKRLNKMREESHKDYSCLVYLMCVQNQELDKDLETWAGLFDAELTRNEIDNINKQKPGYIQIDQENATLIHDVLTIALFKSAAEVGEDFLPVVQTCKVHILLELMRPPKDSQDEFFTSLVNTEKGEDFRNVWKMVVYRLAKVQSYHNHVEKHPLQTGEFKVKYERYLTLAAQPKLEEKKKKDKKF